MSKKSHLISLPNDSSTTKLIQAQNKLSKKTSQNRVDLHGIPVDEHNNYYEGKSYYEWYSQQERIPNVILNDYRKNCGAWSENNFLWFMFCLLLGIANRFSTPRLDHLFNAAYLKQHWCFYFFQWFLYLIVLGLPIMFKIDKDLNFFAGQNSQNVLYFAVIPVLVLCHIFYFQVAWIFLKYPQKWKNMFQTDAKALQYWELFLFLAWLGQTISATMIASLSFDVFFNCFNSNLDVLVEYVNFFEHPAVITIGFLLTAIGFIVKVWVPSLSGLNNYYYYDTLLQIPNERYVENYLYKYVHSPTYMLGYLDGYGAMLLLGWFKDGSPLLGLVWMVLQHLNVNLNDWLIEQPSVYKLYVQPQKEQAEREAEIQRVEDGGA